ncbi:hypothetical protein [Kitasatospora phosalacinea]|uniref:hypothetical protein n=1 Tax=Kitasatospora phosalacinea TaxID=2065 RepID=UPI00068DF154
MHLCGHDSTRTAGADSHLLRRPAGNLMMVDTPRFSPAPAAGYAVLGPVTDVLLTHRDHAAHGRAHADELAPCCGSTKGDSDAAPDADRVIRGTEPVGVAEGVHAHPLPGHTEGSVPYLADGTHCFSGDSFCWSRGTGGLGVAEFTRRLHDLADRTARLRPRTRPACRTTEAANSGVPRPTVRRGPLPGNGCTP